LKKKLKYLIYALLCILASCTENPKSLYPGYSKLDKDLYYHLYSIGDGALKPKKGDLLFFNIKLVNEDQLKTNTEILFDSLVFEKGDEKSLEKALSILNEGDSAGFYIDLSKSTKNYGSASQLITEGKLTRLELKLLKIKTREQQLFEEKSAELWVKEMQQDEEIQLSNYLKKENINSGPQEGIYYLNLREGFGSPVRSGKNIEIHYKAMFLNGTEFYSTYDKEAFEFTYGISGQVLKGMEIGLRNMKTGGKARFVVPSSLAFGEKGSSTNLVGPFKTIIFDVELLKVN